MTRTEIQAGICGFPTVVKATMDGDMCVLAIESECPAIRRLAENLQRVDPLRETTLRGDGPVILMLGQQYCTRAACPVPVGVIKAIEVEAGLALPQDVHIRLHKGREEQ